MTYKRKIKVKDDLNKNPDKLDLSKGLGYLKYGRVKYLKK